MTGLNNGHVQDAQKALLNLLPLPFSVESHKGYLALDGNKKADVKCGSKRVFRAIERLELGGVRVLVAITSPVDSVPDLNDDYSYSLDISGDGLKIEASSDWGAITACSTVRQLISDGHLPYCRIADRPRYAWRGLMIDTVRHFMSIATLKSTIEVMAYFRLNVLHLHLTDDQAFRFRGKDHPELASNQCYEVEELRELVEFAADRAVRIVPEIDVPGHATSWLTARPEWGSGCMVLPTKNFGVHEACLDVTNPVVVRGVHSVIREVAGVFPDRYFHIGGDEVDATWWNASERVQQYMDAHGYTNFREVQSAFNRKLTTELILIGKSPIGWDDVLHPDLSDEMTVQIWRGTRARDTALSAGHDCVVSSPYYLDLCFPAFMHYRIHPDQSSDEIKLEQKKWLSDGKLEHVRGGLELTLDFGGIPVLPDRGCGRVLGGEACMWSELVEETLLDRRVWSRMPAIAERFWSDRPVVDENDLYRRLEIHLARLATEGWMAESPLVPVISEDMKNVYPLLEMLEPVKWYARSLGCAVMSARLASDNESVLVRPYRTGTKLDRIVDRLPPESIAARRCAEDIAAGHDINNWLVGWRLQRKEFDLLARRHPALRELLEASMALVSLADVAEGKCEPDESLGGPFGEYLLPIAWTFIDGNRL